MTNEMQWGVALSMLRQVVSEESGLDRVGEISRVRSALNILRNLDVHDGGCRYEPDRDLCREVPVFADDDAYLAANGEKE